MHFIASFQLTISMMVKWYFVVCRSDTVYNILPVEPHEAVAEVSRIGSV